MPASLASLGIDDELEDEACCGKREHAAEREEDVAPPEQVAEHAAHGLPEKLPQNVARGVARQDRLQTVRWRHIAEISHRYGNDPAGNGAGRKPRQRELRQRRCRSAQRHQQGGKHARDRDGAVFPEPVGHRADHELDGSVRNRISREHNRGHAHGGLEVARDLRQERIGHPHLRLARKAGGREQNDGANRRLAWGGLGRWECR